MTLSAECLVEEAIRAAMRKEPAAEFQRWAKAWLSGTDRSGWDARRTFWAIPKGTGVITRLALQAAWTLAEADAGTNPYPGHCQAREYAQMALYYVMRDLEPA